MNELIVTLEAILIKNSECETDYKIFK